MSDTNIALVGGGMFGVTAAIELARAGANVTLFEKNDDILTAASGSNQWRLHRGYHYPRSVKTARSARESEPKFRELFGEAVIQKHDHYYAIADDSWVPPSEYIEFCDRMELEYERVELDLVSDERIALSLQVEENHVDRNMLAERCWSLLEQHGVTVELEHEITSTDELFAFDKSVLCTYASLNSLIDIESLKREYEFEVCEIPVVSLPERYQGNNIIVVYGPYMSVDHWGNADTFAMGDFIHMVHESNTGYRPQVSQEYEPLLNQGLVSDPDPSNFPSFRDHGSEFIPGVEQAEHVGSMFTIRTKLADVGESDARPSLVTKEGDIVTVFGGKLGTAVETANEVVDLLT
ncbi:FAD-dependent oxidoreductase [Halobacteriales archaeon Cl-PHB]